LGIADGLANEGGNLERVAPPFFER
jgi:hypothetical protein